MVKIYDKPIFMMMQKAEEGYTYREISKLKFQVK